MTSLTAQLEQQQALRTIRIAVVIPCYKQAHFLDEAIESALAQTHGAVEILVVDDGSPDHTAEVAARYDGVRCIRQANLGLSAARNTGLEATDAEFVLFLDSDDRLLPNALHANLACLMREPTAGLAYGAYRDMDEAGNPLHIPLRAPHAEAGDSYAALLRHNIVQMHGTALYRTETLRAVGGFDPALRAAEDYDVYLRIARVATITAHDELVAEYRKYQGTMSFDARLMLRETLRVLRRHKRQAELDPRHREAYREGIQKWKGYYGSRLVSQIGVKIRTRAPIASILGDTTASLANTPGILVQKLAAKIHKKTTGRIGRGARTLLAGTKPRGMILCYHRIAHEASDAWGLHVRPENFARQVETLKETCDVVALRDIASLRRFERPTVALTFDDGYLDNLREALPILEEQKVPATVFVAGGPNHETDEFWWDQLERMLLQPNQLPAHPEFSVAGVPYRFDLAGSAKFSTDDAHRLHGWRAEKWTRPTPRHTMFHVLYAHLASLTADRRSAELATLADALGLTLESSHANRRMTRAEVRELSRSSFIEIGGHTVAHPMLSALSREEQAREILTNRDYLEDIIEKPVRTFAYPHGDYTSETLHVVSDAGFEFACTTRGENLHGAHARFELPRHQIEDWDAAEFTEHFEARWRLS